MVEFAFFKGPIDDPDSAAAAFAVYGRAAAAWARLEHHIDAVLIHINKEIFSQRLYEKNHPVSFERKIDLLKRWFNQHPPLAPFTDEMRTLTSKLKVVAKEDRNVLLHCIFKSYDKDTETLVIQNVQPQPDGNIRIREISVLLSDLNRFAEHVNVANRFLGSISLQIFTPGWIERLRTP